MIKGIHHVALKCAGPDQFREVMIFYTEVIGLTVTRTWGSGENAAAMLGAGNCIVEVFASGQVSGSTGSINHFAFLTDDPDECVRRVREAGYQITAEPKDVEIHQEHPEGEVYPLRVAFCIGPIGEEIEFFCER